MGDHVLVPFDGSGCAERALRRAVERYPAARVTALSVVEPLSPTGCARLNAPLDTEADGLRADGSGDLQTAERIARERDVDLRTVRVPGTPAAAIVDYAAGHDVDAIVVGTHGRTGIRRLLFGSVAETVARHASVPVTLVE